MNFLINVPTVARSSPDAGQKLQQDFPLQSGGHQQSNTRALFVLLGLAAVVRVPGMFTDFWLDEVWTHQIASQLKHWPDLFLSDAGRIDNSHPLLTAWIMLIGQTRHVWLYRLPSLIGGVFSTWFAWRIAYRQGGRVVAMFAASIIALAFPFAFYASEARGYALAVAFALLAFDMLSTTVENFSQHRRSHASITMFSFACLAGVLSHLTFIPFLGAMTFWSVLAIRRCTPTIVQQIKRWLSLFALPLGSTFWLHHYFIRHLTIGGAAPTDPAWTIVQSMSLVIGGPMRGIAAGIIAAAVAGLFLTALVHLARAGHADRAMFYVLAVIVMPCGLLAYDLILSARPQPLMPRYFLIPMAIAAVAISHALAVAMRNAIHRAAVAFLLAVVLVTNAIHWIDFAENGRGRSTAALTHILATTSYEFHISVGTDSPFRVGSIIEFNRLAMPALNDVQTFGDDAGHPFWWIASGTAPPPHADQYIVDSTYPAGELSGTTWTLYRHH